MSENKKILYIFHRCREKDKSGNIKIERPNTLLYGYDYFLNDGNFDVSFLDSTNNEILMFLDSILSFFSFFFFRLSFKLGTILSGFHDIKENEIVFCTADGVLLPLLLLKKLGLFKRNKIFGVSIGLINNLDKSFWKRTFVRSLYKKAEKIIVYSSREKDAFERILNIDNIIFIKFGIDTDFFKNSDGYLKDKNEDRIFFSLGKDSERDFELLINAWKIASARENEVKKIKLIIGVRREKLKYLRKLIDIKNSNIEIIEENKLNIGTVKEFYGKMILGIVPLKKTLRSSGQIVVLSMLSMGKKVLTDFNSPGILDIKQDLGKEVFFGYKAGNLNSLIEEIINAVKSKDKELSDSKKEALSDTYSTKSFYLRLKDIFIF